MTNYEKAEKLLMTGRLISAHEANDVLGWKFSTYISLVIKDLEKNGYEVQKQSYGNRNQHRTYQVKGV